MKLTKGLVYELRLSADARTGRGRLLIPTADGGHEIIALGLGPYLERLVAAPAKRGGLSQNEQAAGAGIPKYELVENNSTAAPTRTTTTAAVSSPTTASMRTSCAIASSPTSCLLDLQGRTLEEGGRAWRL